MHDEIKKFQGTWNVVALEIEGSALTNSVFGGSKIVIEGNRFTTKAMGATYEGTFSINTECTPKSLDMNFTSGPEKGNCSLGIYEIDGDNWKLCLTVSGRTRPVEFATSPKSGHALETLVRESGHGRSPVESTQTKSEPGRAESAASGGALKNHLDGITFEPVPELEGEWSMVSCLRDGYPLDKRMVSTGVRIATENDTTVSFGGQAFIQARFTVDTAATPHKIDYYHTGGMNAGQQQSGIYELSEGLLKISFASIGKDRPQDFSSKVGDGRTVTVWRKK